MAWNVFSVVLGSLTLFRLVQLSPREALRISRLKQRLLLILGKKQHFFGEIDLITFDGIAISFKTRY